NLFAEEIISRLSEKPAKEIKNEAEVLELLTEGPLSLDGRFCLKAESHLLQHAYANNKILSLSNSRTKILAHQVESTYRIVNSLNQRFILADEVGLGKTIEAGLVIKELIFRYKYRRIIIVAPASLLVQWQCEMEEKFGENFEIITRKTISRLRRDYPGDNPWMKIDRGICSVDFIKSLSFKEELENAMWDAVIFDEAHRLRRDAQVTTLAYNAAEIMAARCKALLLLTATPFRGKLEELFFLVRLADRNLLGPYQSFYNDYCMPDSDLTRLKEKLSTILLRRTKKEIGGFTVRFARTIRFELYGEERALYDATTHYVAEEFNRAMQTQNRAVGFVMTVFQKLLDSSSYALCSALRNRKMHLEEKLAKAEKNALRMENAAKGIDFSDPELVDVEDPNALVTASARQTVSELKEEIFTIEHLIRLAESVKRNKKAEKLLEMIKQLKTQGYDKFLIFTQFRTTQDYLAKMLEGYDVVVFNGSMDKDQKEDAIIRFKQDAEILICTEAGGEGRNMQFCSVLFNYDLPWSPLKIEQRIGRIHRFGQKYDVCIYNFSTKDTVAERVLDVLSRKFQLFEDSIGTQDIMLGQIEDELQLSSLFMDMTTGRKSKKAADQELDNSIARAKASYEKLSELAVAKKMDFNYDEYYRVTQKDRVFSNKQLESFVARAAASAGDISLYIGAKSSKTGLYPVRAIPGGKQHHPYGTFDSERALADPAIEFLAFGHPLVDFIIARSQSNDFGGTAGVQFIRYEKPFEGMVFYYRATYTSVSESRELIPVVVEPSGRIFSFEQERIERECVRQTDYKPDDCDRFRSAIDRVLLSMWEMKSNARERICEKVEHKVWDMREQLDLTIDPEIEKIRESCDRHTAELTAQLERQENQMRLFGKDMRGAITRTKNRITETSKEKEHLLASYRRRLGVSCSIELISAGVLISEGNDR
ncbi:MAG: DEAD/DEAH box helicase, partial [Spirochaetota bacterium]